MGPPFKLLGLLLFVCLFFLAVEVLGKTDPLLKVSLSLNSVDCALVLSFSLILSL